MTRLLFVNDDAADLRVLRETLAAAPREWDPRFAANPWEALSILSSTTVDVVAADARLLKMDGADLLAQIASRYPQAVRMVVAGEDDREQVYHSRGLVHHYLPRAGSLMILEHAVERAQGLRTLLAEPRLKRLVSRMGSLPSVPSLHVRVIEECNAPAGSLLRVGEMIAEDPGMTAKILQVVNSAFFGLRRRVSNPIHAVQLLGQNTVRALVLWNHLYAQFDESGRTALAAHDFWGHSVTVSAFARLIAMMEGADQETIDEAGVAGLLHDTGMLALAATLGARAIEPLAVAERKQMALWEAELELLGTTHGALGGHLLALWALPGSIVEAVTFSHYPRQSFNRAEGPLPIVHAAEALAAELGPTRGPEAGTALDTEYLRELGLEHRVEEWREACLAGAQEATAG